MCRGENGHMQARILNLNTSIADKRRGGARPEDESPTRANLLLYNSGSSQPQPALDGESVACRSLKYQVADLWSAFLATAEGRQHSDLARMIDKFETEVNTHWRNHTLLDHWTELDERADLLATMIQRNNNSPIKLKTENNYK